jgi:hypothetical protein
MMMLRHPLVPDGRGHGRTPAERLSLNERDRYLREASKFFPGASGHEVARLLRIALLRYRAGAWRRDCSEALCPLRYRGTLKQALWCVLKSRDATPAERTIRRILAAPTRGPNLVGPSDPRSSS